MLRIDVHSKVAKVLAINITQVKEINSLLAEGATVPFIARYRKERTGGADEVLVQKVKDLIAKESELHTRKEFVLTQIEKANALSSLIQKKIESAVTLAELDDIYLPYKPTRTTKGQKAVELGLKPLAIYIQQNVSDVEIENYASKFVRNGIKSTQEALEGAVHVLAEWHSKNEYVVHNLRKQFERYGVLQSKLKRGKKQEAIKFSDYFDFQEKVNFTKSHRVLAIFRAEKLGFLNVKIVVDEQRAIENIVRGLGRNYVSNTYNILAVKDCYSRVLQPYFESEIKKQLRLAADEESIAVFAENLKQLLLQAPLGKKVVLAIDPGFRTGCKAVVLNAMGQFKAYKTIYLHPPKVQQQAAEYWVLEMIQKYKVEAIAIGNGTGGKETKLWIQKIVSKTIPVYFVNEDGASIYSASEIARKEFEDLDLTVRGAISIGRRLMDPLAELVKIEAKSIGVGQYQHDVNQPLLRKKLDEVVAHCVNYVGVDVNLASAELLTHVSGVGKKLADNIVRYRKEKGKIQSRSQLLEVDKLGPKAYEQCAGFLRVEDGLNILDNTIIHPEMYGVVKLIAIAENKTINQLFRGKRVAKTTKAEFNQQYGSQNMGLIWQHIEEIRTVDPRASIHEQKENQITSIADVYEGLTLNGVVNNITNFGAFVDIGIKESGLVHISEISNQYVSDINQVVRLNQAVKVKVLKVIMEQKRIQLTMKNI